MVRAPALDVISAMQRAAAGPGADGPAPAVLVLSSEGDAVPQRGVGKTTSLLHAVHWARASGWVVLHVPSAVEVMEGGLWISPSPYVSGDFDQPQVAAAILGDLLATHAAALEALPPLTEAGAAGPAGAGGPVKSLRELAEAGVANEAFGSRCVAVLREELALQKEVEPQALRYRPFVVYSEVCRARVLTYNVLGSQVPVLIAVDDYNALFEESKHFFELNNVRTEATPPCFSPLLCTWSSSPPPCLPFHHTRSHSSRCQTMVRAQIPAEKLTLVKALRDLSSCGTALAPAPVGAGPRPMPVRGLVVAAETTRLPRSKDLDYFSFAGKILAGSAACGTGPAEVRRLPVQNLDAGEFDALCDFFAEAGVLNGDSAQARGMLMLQSQANLKALVRRIMLS